MASGDVTDEYDNRARLTPVCGLTLEIVVAGGTSEKEEELNSLVHTCMNCLLTDIYLEAPAIATVSKEIKLELLTERDNVIYSTGDLDATNAVDHPIHLQRGMRGKTAFKITCDANVTGAKTFYIEVRGV